MKQAQNSRNKSRARSASRNKGGAKNNGGNPGNRVDIRVRGNPKQHLEKYKNLAREAMQAGDRVQAEYYFQFADHWQRVLNELRGPDRFYDDEDGDAEDVADDEDSGDSDDDADGQQGEQEERRDRGNRDGNRDGDRGNREGGRRNRGRGRGRGGRPQEESDGDEDSIGNRAVEAAPAPEGELPLQEAAPARAPRRRPDPAESEQPVEVHPELEFEGGALREVKPRRGRPPRRRPAGDDTPNEGGEAA